MATETNYRNDYFDRVLNLLSPPDLSSDPDNSWATELSHSLELLSTFIKRIWNYCFGDKIWHDESSARQILEKHITNIQSGCQVPFEPSHIEKIYAIYLRLYALKNEETGKNWAFGISPHQIGSSQVILKRIQRFEKEYNKHLTSLIKNHPVDPEKIHNVFLAVAKIFVQEGKEICDVVGQLKNLTDRDKALFRCALLELSNFLQNLHASCADDLNRGEFVVVTHIKNNLHLSAERIAKIQNAQRQILGCINSIKNSLVPLTDGPYHYLIKETPTTVLPQELFNKILMTLAELFMQSHNESETFHSYTVSLECLESIVFPSEIVWEAWSHFAKQNHISVNDFFKANTLNRVAPYYHYFRGEGARVSQAFLQCTLEQSKNLRTIELVDGWTGWYNQNRPYIENKALELITEKFNLQTFRVDLCQNINGGITEKGVKHLEKMDNLTNLDLMSINLSDELLQSVGKLTKLFHLHLEGHLKISSPCIWDNLTQLPALRSLTLHLFASLENDPLAPPKLKLQLKHHVNALPETINRLSSLTKLDLCGNFSSSSPIQGLPELIHLEFNHWSTNKIHSLASFKTLQTFQSGNLITDDWLEEACQLTSLKLLNLNCSDVSFKGMAHLASCTYLTELYVNSEAEVDLKWLQEARKITCLKTLDVDISKITDPKARALALDFMAPPTYEELLNGIGV